MTLIKLASMVSQRAGLLTKDQKEMLRKGEIKSVLNLLGINSVKKPDGFTHVQWNSIKAKIVNDKWLQIGFNNLTQNEIENNL